MWDVFEQPWTLLGAAVIVLLIVFTVRAVLPEKRRLWLWLFPLGVGGLAVGLDALVATDLEKINELVKTGVRAVEQEDCAAIARLLSEDYADSYHKDKQAAVSHCRSRLVPPAIDKITKIGEEVKITSPEGVATFTVIVRFDKSSVWAQSYKPSAMVKLQFHLRKQRDGTWRVRRAEILEVDKMAVTSWGVARASHVKLQAIIACQSRTHRVEYVCGSSTFALGG
ncbi:MAG TPA: hypothetical protein PKH24_20515 [Sedimentisphaerales bacterium]|jgi:ketosteroid isomerase-like protein|nr:hypothetical protein [Sedimentisphaerales bacterium]HNU31573.1 hypothetical protein [Sedimentisphaerales bacterium]